MDLLYIALGIGFFVLTAVLVSVFDGLRRR
jgi:hypothetical protein